MNKYYWKVKRRLVMNGTGNEDIALLYDKNSNLFLIMKRIRSH